MKKIINIFILVISITILAACNSDLPKVGENPKDLANLIVDNEAHTITYQYLSKVDLSTEDFFGNILYNRKIYKNDTMVSKITFDPTGENVYKVELIYRKTVISYTVILDTSRVVAVYGVNGTLAEYIFKDEANKLNSSDLSSLAGASVVKWFTTSTFNQIANLDNYSSNAIYARGINSYTLTFNSNGGSSINSITKDKGSVITIPDNPVKAGYTFNGWYDNGQLDGNIVSFPYTLSGDTTLYAKWIKFDYSITYNLNGGINHVNNPEGYSGEEAIILQSPTRIGYAFDGWTNEEGIPIVSILKGYTGNITLYANWIKNNYSITYNLDGGTNHASNPETYTIEDAFELNIPTKAGYTFAGWFKEDNFIGIKFTEITIGSTEDIILYAKWIKNDYSITYNLNGGTNHASNPDGYSIEEAIILRNPTKTGYTFDGWVDEDGTPTISILKGHTGSITLYAKWIAIEYDIEYFLKGGDHASNPDGYNIEDTIILQSPTRSGYTFAGWFKDVDFSGVKVTEITIGSTGNIILYAKWIKNNYSITYNLDDGTNHANNPHSYDVESNTITLQNPTRDGYTFAGWHNETSIVATIPQGSSGHITLTATWTINSYTITFNSNNGSSVGPITQNYNFIINKPDNPTRTGHTFEGWFISSNLSGNAISFPYTIKDNITLYAKWEIITYKISYDLNDGDDQTTNFDDNPESYTIETTTITLKASTRDGYEFKGWFDESNEQIFTINKGSIGNITLTARWEEIIYTAYFFDNDGSGLFYSERFTIENGITFPVTPINSIELEFIGWFTANGNKIEEFLYDNQEVKLFYAHYSNLPNIWQGRGIEYNEREDLYYMEFGMYPQTVIPLGELHDILTAGGANVKATGEFYTANLNASAWSLSTYEENPVYSYLGAKYVKVTPYAAFVDANHKYNDTTANPEQIGQNGVDRWFKVEPIKWIIINYNDDDITFVQSDEKRSGDVITDFFNLHIVNKSATLELYAADILMGGIAFNASGNVLWTDSTVKTYLNNDFYNQAFSSNDKLQIQVSTIYNNTDWQNENNPSYSLNSNYPALTGGTGYNQTEQRIYILSKYELENAISPYVAANPIFTSNTNRQVPGTDYARAHILALYNSGGIYYPSCWTRSASSSNFVYYINNSGSFSSSYAGSSHLGMRPALQLKLES